MAQLLWRSEAAHGQVGRSSAPARCGGTDWLYLHLNADRDGNSDVALLVFIPQCGG